MQWLLPLIQERLKSFKGTSIAYWISCSLFAILVLENFLSHVSSRRCLWLLISSLENFLVSGSLVMNFCFIFYLPKFSSYFSNSFHWFVIVFDQANNWSWKIVLHLDKRNWIILPNKPYIFNFSISNCKLQCLSSSLFGRIICYNVFLVDFSTFILYCEVLCFRSLVLHGKYIISWSVLCSYLQWLIEDQDSIDTQFHTLYALSLAKSAIETFEVQSVSKSPDDERLEEAKFSDFSQKSIFQSPVRERLQIFLLSSDLYDPEEVLDLIEGSELWLEKVWSCFLLWSLILLVWWQRDFLNSWCLSFMSIFF